MADLKISELTDYTPAIDVDEVAIVDTTTTTTKKITWANVKATLKTYFDGLYAAIANPTFTGTVTLPKAVNIKDTSADHEYQLAVSELTANRIITLPLLTGADEFVFKAHTQTLTNKRITARVKTFTSDATPDIDSDDYDAVTITAQAAAITDVNVTGTPTNFQKLLFRIKDNATARAITWGDDFEDAGVALPTTTVVSKLLTVGFIYNTVTSKWGCVAVGNET